MAGLESRSKRETPEKPFMFQRIVRQFLCVLSRARNAENEGQRATRIRLCVSQSSPIALQSISIPLIAVFCLQSDFGSCNR